MVNINNNKRRNTAISIRQTFFRQPLLMKQFAKLYPHQTFPLYGNEIFDKVLAILGKSY